ncbi:malate dehydrogenase, mitochondrial-like isoform X3 [Spodoptera frugiperda]|uniref:Malate dehydrogenase, mitochondrial n=1 Tax=Spodoptera frugiperda TaxID=7108 RepID=A0A9R0D831_SPOFR|nr:malate dehydrogenase, mitochondrial-like isoform X3 [Spodoptera frugiperda]
MFRTLEFWSHVVSSSRILKWQAVEAIVCRCYAKKARNDGCARAHVDIPPAVDPLCPQPCERRKKKKEGILHKIKLKVIEGGTNFGTPFRRVECKEVCPKKPKAPPKALPAPAKKLPPMPEPRPGVQVSVLGADTAIGQYLALLLKQCSCIKKLRLYEAKDSQGCNRDLCSVVQDLQHINTNCLVQAFSCACYGLERCLQNSDIVLMLESGYLNVDMPVEKRFLYQAPIVKSYADAIANECPKAFIIVCATPIDCMVPLIAETLKETGWYDPNKLLGSLAVPEMRASTLAARALCLEPRYTRVPCVGGTEGDTLVPLFSKAVEYFDFAQHNTEMMTEAVRNAPSAVSRCDGPCQRVGDLSEAHALAGLVTAVAHALLCHDIPRVTGFVETDLRQVISPARYLASDLLLNHRGVCKRLSFPPRLSSYELGLLDLSLFEMMSRYEMVMKWHCSNLESMHSDMSKQKIFATPRHYKRFKKC